MENRLVFPCLVLAGMVTVPAWATESGGGMYPNGVETFGVGDLPPPGVHYLNSLNYYDANRVNDGSGNKINNGFHLRALVDSHKFTWVTDKTFLGANFGIQLIVPMALDFDLKSGGKHQNKTGLGDITVTPLILGWHRGDLHYVFATDVNVPTGQYDKDNLANIGRNYYNIEPLVAVTYSVKDGPEISAKFMYDYNFENNDTNYKSGQEFHVDYAIGWNFGAVTLGGSGYYYKQVTDDEADDSSVGTDGNKGMAVAFGPAIRWKLPGVMLFGAWQHEFESENRSQGEKIWLRAAMSF